MGRERRSLAPLFVLALSMACGESAPPAAGAGTTPSGVPIVEAGAPSEEAGADAGNDASADAGADASEPPKSVPEAWAPQTIYLVIPDRFANGDPTNDALGGCFDPAAPFKSHGGDLAGLRARIPYLRELGVTALWITPPNKQARCGYHGYWPDYADPDDGAIDPTMGTDATLRDLIADLHAAGIRLVLDMVVNHSGRDARVLKSRPTWFHDPATCGALGDPAVYCPLGTLPDFAQEKPEVAAYLTAISTAWLTRFAIDGIRMDTVKHVPLAFWQDTWLPAVKKARPGTFVVGEVFDGDPKNLSPFLRAGFDSLFNYPLFYSLGATFAAGGSVDAIADRMKEEIDLFGIDTARMMTSFVDNHDNVRFTSQITGTTEGETAARQHLALGAIFTLPGIPQLYYGDELALYGAKDPDNRRDMPPWAWSAADRKGPHAGASAGDAQATFAHVQRLVAIRSGHSALYRGSYAELWRQAGGAANVLAFFRGDGSDRAVVVFNNASAASGAVPLPIQSSHNLGAVDRAALVDGTVMEDLLGEGAPATVTIKGGVMPVELPAKTMAVYVVRRPVGGLVTRPSRR